MSVYETSITNSKKQLEFYKELSEQLQRENQELKQKLNWIAFGDDPELSLRYLRKIGYVDFDEERKVYINKHNNEPFLLKTEQEKSYYLKDDELNEYTEQLEYKIKKLKKQLSNSHQIKNQQKEFIEYLEDYIDTLKQQKKAIEGLDIGEEHILMTLEEVLEKYKEIIGAKDE